MKIDFYESSDYGQDVLELMGTIVSLQDEGKEYTKTEINSTLIRARVIIDRIQRDMKGRDKDSYFEVKG